MPEINDVLDATTDEKIPGEVTGTPVIDATVVEKSETPAPELPVSETGEADKPKKKVVKKKATKTEVVDPTEAEDAKLRRPPMEQIVRDFEEHVLGLEVAGKALTKLGYKCGKVIFGIANTEGGKDFRVIAFKARKKTKSVAGKSRCIFYFGLSDTKAIKDLTGVKVSKFGKCSVQSEKPVELTLDKVTFTETFAKDADKVFETLTKLAAIAIEHKTESFNEKATKLAEKAATKKTSSPKKEKELKTKK